MNYIGKNKHSTEELEEIIDSLLEEKYNKEFENKDKIIMYDKLCWLVREIYNSCKTPANPEDDEIGSKTIISNLEVYLQNFGRDNNFEL